MAPLTIYPDRRYLFWLTLACIPVVLILLAGAALTFVFGLDAGGKDPLPPMALFLFAMTVIFGVFMAAGLGWMVARLRNPGPALSIEDRGIRLLDRPPLSLAKRPVFLPWVDIAVLRFERASHGARTLQIKTRAGQTHRVIASTLNTDLQVLQDVCLDRARTAGLIGTSTRRGVFPVACTEWRLAPT
ncbi:hypothetical protein [Tropicimonas sp. S265A]|uniref:hypothetical protein n=1 Tax=Tropicimonas sp. S265A TaxID=3415134 RepID=UPI003C7CE149